MANLLALVILPADMVLGVAVLSMAMGLNLNKIAALFIFPILGS